MFDEFSPLFSTKMSRLIKERGLPPGHCCKLHSQKYPEFLGWPKYQLYIARRMDAQKPGCSPNGFWYLGILKRRLQKRRIRSLHGLKRALYDEWNKLEQPIINRVLSSWPKRCRLIYRCHGLQNEQLVK